MRTLAILPIKGLTQAKTRLSERLGAGSRKALAQAMFLDVLAALRRVDGLDGIVVVTSDPVAERAARAKRVALVPDGAQAGHSAAALLGIRHALAERAERVLLVPGDTPLLDADEVAGLLRRAAGAAVTVVPDRHGTGTNALVLSPPTAIAPSFGPGSCARHLALAVEAGVEARVDRVPTLLHDVDTPDDLAALVGALEAGRRHAPMTRGALSQLRRSGAAGSAPRERAPRERSAAADNVRVIGAAR